MSVSLSPIGGVAAQFFDNNGNVLAGGKLYSYEAGTTTPKTTYTSYSGTIANSNPIILTSAGRIPYEVWLTTGDAYKFVLTDSIGNQIGTWDNIYGYSSGTVDAQTEVQYATADQTLFVLTGMAYTPGANTLGVYVDGVNQVVGNAYVETNATSVTFVSGLHEGATVKFINLNIGSTDASVVSYEPGLTGSVATTVQAKLRESVSVKDFGALGDGVTDDTAAIQAAIDASNHVFFPAGTYLCALVYIRSGLSLVGYGATLKLLPNQSNFTRLLTTQNNLLNQVADSEPLNVIGLTLNGNRVNQGTYTGYEKEQQQLLFLDAGDNNTGRLVTNISNCDFVESCSDGIGIYRGVDININNCHFWNCFRGSITPIGGYSKIKFTNVSAGGDVHNSFLNIEPDGGGGGTGDLSLDICGSNSVFEGTLDCGMQHGGTARFDNVRFKGIGLDIIGSNSGNLLNFRAVNCEFTVQIAANSYFQYPNFVQFDNCKFNHSENNGAGPYINVVWGANSNQRIVFNGCQHVHVGAGAFTTTAAVYVSEGTVAANNVVEFDGGSIGDGSATGDLFTYGVYLANGGAVKMDNTVIHSDYIALATAGTSQNYSVHLGQVTLGANNIGFLYLNSTVSGNSLRFDNTVVENSKNVIDTSVGWASGFTILGSRVIQGASAPTGTTVAFAGDHYRLTTPVAGSAYEYVATNTSYTAAVWKTSATLAA